MTDGHFYPIGKVGEPWGPAEVEQWRRRQTRHRSYAEDVASRIEALAGRYEILTYGELAYAGEAFPLLAVRTSPVNAMLPTALVTGGVHGYETSGVLGALAFLETKGLDYAGRLNLLVVPCVSPWGYERINRWNFDAVDPNRNFRADGPSKEATALIQLVRSAADDFLVHIDLHETTDTDATEFSPARASRDGKPYQLETIPDGFYVVDDSANPQPAFQQAIVAAVERVTHIALEDAAGEIIGSPVVAHGVIEYPLRDLGLCPSITGAPYTTTTEVYPDSGQTSPAECTRAQVTAIVAALDYALEQA
jgi:hypothetical protein